MGVAPVKVLPSRWYTPRPTVSERTDRQAHGILKVFPIIPSEKRGCYLDKIPVLFAQSMTLPGRGKSINTVLSAKLV